MRINLSAPLRTSAYVVLMLFHCMRDPFYRVGLMHDQAGKKKQKLPNHIYLFTEQQKKNTNTMTFQKEKVHFFIDGCSQTSMLI